MLSIVCSTAHHCSHTTHMPALTGCTFSHPHMHDGEEKSVMNCLEEVGTCPGCRGPWCGVPSMGHGGLSGALLWHCLSGIGAAHTPDTDSAPHVHPIGNSTPCSGQAMHAPPPHSPYPRGSALRPQGPQPALFTIRLTSHHHKSCGRRFFLDSQGVAYHRPPLNERGFLLVMINNGITRS